MARAYRSSTADTYGNQLSKLKSDLAELARVVGETADKEKRTIADGLLKQAHGVVDYLSDHASTLGERAEELREQSAAAAARVSASISESADDIADRIAAEIRERPLRTLAIAGGIGLIFGWLSRR